MRDPGRIDPILEEVRRIWKKNPDLRLVQVFRHIQSLNQGPMDSFYVEDVEWEKILKDAK